MSSWDVPITTVRIYTTPFGRNLKIRVAILYVISRNGKIRGHGA